MASSDSKVAKAQSQFQTLTKAASSLNVASDELTKGVALLDEALKKLNIGLSVWVNYSFGNVEDPEYDVEQIGYAKVQGKWGIVLRHIWGNEQWDHHEQAGPWLFNDGPREMRIHAVDKIPDLIEELAKTASKTTERMREKTEMVCELAAAVGKIASPDKGQR